MNKRILELAEEAGFEITPWRNELLPCVHQEGPIDIELEKFAELIKREIYDEVKEGLVEDELINRHRDSLVREYLKGNNRGIVDALNCIKHFSKDIEE